MKVEAIHLLLRFSAFPEPSSSGLTRGSTAITDYGYPAFAEYDDKEKDRKPKCNYYIHLVLSKSLVLLLFVISLRTLQFEANTP